MLWILLYLTLLFIAPQLWIQPFVGLEVDFILYPLWLAYCLFTGRLGAFFRFDSQDALFLLMIGWFAVSILVNGWADDSTEILVNYGKWFVLYRLVVATVGDMARLRSMGWMLVLFAAILAVEGIQHFHSPDGLGWAGQTLAWVDERAKEVGLDKRTRWINIFDGPGVFCVAYTIALPFALNLIGAPYGRLTRVLGVALVGMLLLGTYYTGSRGGYITAVAICGLYMALKTRLSAKRLAAGAMLGIAVLLVLPGYVTSTRDSSRSAQHRVDMWAEGIEMVQQNPVIGIGKGNFQRYTSRLIAHNSVIETMGETGFVGLFLWLGIAYMAFKKVILFLRGGAAAESDAACARALAISLAGYLLSGMFVTLEYETYYMLLGMTAVVGQALPAPARFNGRDAVNVTGLMAFFYLAFKIFVMAY